VSNSQLPLRSNLVKTSIPTVESDYTASEVEIDIEDLNESGSSASDEYELRPARRGSKRGRGSTRGRPASRGRGRGRGRGRSRGRPSTRGRGQKRLQADDPADEDRTPRKKKKKKSKAEKDLQSTPEFKRLNGLITTAWMESDYETALRYALEAIQIHPEVFQLHGTIAEILVKKGRPQDAIGALFAGVHSSRDPENWWYVIDRINDLGDDSEQVRAKLGYCYKALAKLSPDDYQARIGKLKYYRDSGLFGRAKNECQVLLSIQPTDVIVLQQLAELCSMLDVPNEALHPFEEFLGECLENEDPGRTHLTWELISSYLDLLVQVERYEEALGQLKSLSRWLLGRGEEDYWDSLDDDREWDDADEARRIRVAEYTPGVYDVESYGLGLPLEFRIKLGCLRVQMGDDNLEEALVSSSYSLCLHPN
jgi:general transcription factor 3C polypeptide 3 (transcription factor C subunit 4)